jgi:hypothetical protein
LMKGLDPPMVVEDAGAVVSRLRPQQLT